MADFAAVLRKTIDALKENTPEMRAKVYQKARATIDAKLAAASLPEHLAQRQKGLLEEAIAKVETEYAAPAAAAASPASDDLDSLLSEMQRPVTRPSSAAGAKQQEAAAEEGEAGEPREAADEDAFGEAQAPLAAQDGRATGEWFPEAVNASPEGPEAAGPEDGYEHLAGDRPRRRRGGGLVVLLLFLLVLGGIGYGGWIYRDEIVRVAGLGDSGGAPAVDATQEVEEEPAEPVLEASVESEPEAEEPPAATADEEEQPPKFTQRLTPDGEEIEEGPAEGEPTIGEGTSVAEATQSSAPVTEEAAGGGEAAAAEAPLPVGQKAIFYEERTNVSEGSADSGAVVWSLVEESPGNNLPPEPAIRGEATIPEKGLQLKMTIRRNVDQSLPASHIMELIFLTPEDFQGGGINNVLRVAMKRSEQDTGSPLLGIPAKIADGFFLVALSDSRADQETNLLLLRRQSWIDIPIVYTSGRRALITMEKGVPGEQVFNEALESWARAAADNG